MKAENSRISDLVIKAKNGDKAAFEELYKLTSPKAYFVALKICNNEHDAEDILQESYIKALEKIDTVDPEGNFTAWLYQIVANRSKNFVKAKKPVLFSGEEEEIIGSLPDEDMSFSPEEQVDREELRSEVMAAVDELSAEKRACVMMMYFGDMSVNEIAQSLEVPVSTVKNRLFTARKDLKNKFEKKGITALYSAAPLGVVIWALSKTGETTAAAFAASSASSAILAGVGASSTTGAVTGASTAGTATTATATGAASATTAAAATGTGIAAKVAALSVAQKVVAGIAAVSVIGGSTAGVATVAKKIVSSKETTTYVEEVTTAPSQTDEYAFAVIPDEESTTAELVSDITETSLTLPSKETTTKRAETTTLKASEASSSTTKATTAKQTTTNKVTTTKAATTKAATTTKPTTTQEETTTRPTTTQQATTQPTTTRPTTTQPTTTEPTTKAKATVNVEVIDMNEDVVATFSFTVEADTEMTWEYLVSQIKNKGYEPKAGIYGDAVGAVAEAGRSYSITAEL